MLHPEKILYEAQCTATGGRDGKAASDLPYSIEDVPYV